MSLMDPTDTNNGVCFCVYVWVPADARELVRSLGEEVTGVVSHQYECWDSNPGLHVEQPLPSAETSSL